MEDYELLDVGAGARLERFGSRIVDRPHPGAYGDRADPELWSATTLFHGADGQWHGSDPVEPWTVAVDDLTVELRPTDTGQVGLFPEQAESWAWLRDVVASRLATTDRAPTVLNLFAYTGLASLAAAAAGAAVAHVDASRPAVTWARRNAELSGLAGRSIRWLVDDVPAFVARELRRGHRYDGVVLDPPTYGHGPRGRAWRLEDDLDVLLSDCAGLVGGRSGFVLLTAHTPGFEAERLAAALGEALRVPTRRIDAGPLRLRAASGRHLDLGAFARWPGGA